MASVVVTLKIMPSDPDVDLSAIEEQATEMIAAFGGEVGKVEHEKVAFGIVALKLIFVMEEKIGSTEKLENQIATIENVESVDVSDIRRAIG